MRIGELAGRSGFTTKTIRYYESIDLLPEPERSSNGYRDYQWATLDRLGFIRLAKASGLTLDQIRSIIAFRERGETPCTHVRALIEERAAEIDQRIAELQALRQDLSHLAERARTLDPADCRPDDICHIIGEPSTPRDQWVTAVRSAQG